MISEKKYLTERFNELREYSKHREKSVFFLCHTNILDRCLNVLSEATSNILLFDQVDADFHDLVNNPEFVLHENDDIINFKKYIKNQNIHPIYSRWDSSCVYNQYYGVLFEINYYNFLRKDIVLESLIEKVSKRYYISGYYQTEKLCSIIKLSKYIRRNISNNSLCNTEAVLVRGGYGDIIMLLPLLQTFINQKKSQGIKVHIVTSLGEKVSILEKYLENCEIRYFNFLPDNYYYLNQIMLMSGEYQNYYYISPVIPPMEEPYHITGIWSKILNISNIGDSYKIFREKDFPIENNDILEKIESMKRSHKVIIGVHFHSYHDVDKSWPEEYARSFVLLCHHNNIGIVNLGPNNFKFDVPIIDFGHIPVVSMFGIIKNLTVIVAIDSCFGHMAGVLGIPNITIWGKGYPHRAEMRPVSYRSVSNNFSLAAKDMNILHIKPEIVYKNLCDILTGHIRLKDSYITIDDSIAQLDVCWVES